MIDLFILMVIVIGLSLAVYHIAQFSTRETTFEQAIEEQRQKRDFEIYNPKTEKDKLPKKPAKVKKIKGKRENENHSSQLLTSSSHDPSNHVEASSGKKVQHPEPSPKPNSSENSVKKIQTTVSNETVANNTGDLKKKKKKERSEETIVDQNKTNEANIKSGNAISSVINTSVIAQPAASKISVTANNASATKQIGKGPSQQLQVNKEPIQQSTKKNNPQPNKGVTQQPPTKVSPAQQVNKGNSQQQPSNKGSAQQPQTVKGTANQVKQSKTSQPQNIVPNESSKIVSKKTASPVKERKTDIANSSKLVQEQIEIIETQLQDAEKTKKKANNKVVEERKPKHYSVSDDALSHLLPFIHKSPLNGAEIQMLIETLLNKQQLTGETGGEWVEKGRVDPAQQLKRQLEEAETKLEEQLEAHKALSAKIIVLRSDLNNERARSSTLKKQLDNSSVLLQQRLDAANVEYKESLKSKLNELKLKLEGDFEGKVIQQTQVAKADLELQNKQLQTNLSEVEKQLQQTRATNNQAEQNQQKIQTALCDVQQQLLQAVSNRDELMQTCQQYQQHINVLKEQLSHQEASFNAKVAELQQNVSASEEAKSQSLSQYTTEREQIHQELTGVRDLLSQSQIKLKETVREKEELESRLRSSESDATRSNETIKNLKSQVECLIEEKDSLASQSVRPAAEGQENGDIHTEHKEEVSSSNHLSAMFEEKISNLTKEVSRLKEDLALKQRKNDENKDKWEKETKHFREVLLRIYPNINISEDMEQSAILKQVETAAIAAQTTEVNPQVIEKTVEKLVTDPKLVKEIEELKQKNDDFQKQIEELKKELSESQEATSAEEETASRITELEGENKSLEAKVAHYQNVLTSTETLLKTLQTSVENEEAGWKEKIIQKEELVRQLNADKANLTLRVSELQSALDKVKQAEEMESQLNSLKEKLEENEQEKLELKTQLSKVQDQLKSASVSSQAINANGPANGVDSHEVDDSCN